MRRLMAIALVGVAAVALPLQGQRGMVAGPAVPTVPFTPGLGQISSGPCCLPGTGATVTVGNNPNVVPRTPRVRPRFFPGSAFFPGFFPGDTVVVEPSQPQVVENAPPVVHVKEETKPGSPLLIEWQGNRFVRLNLTEETAADGRQRIQPDYAEAAAAPSPKAAVKPQPQAQELAPAVLAFKDGHRLEVSSYVISGPALYASASYWTQGYWSKKILLADLDLPATIKLNQERGVAFVLPAAPNQIVTRP